MRTLRQAYKKAALKYHPDKNPDSIPQSKISFQAVSEAHCKLKAWLSDSNDDDITDDNISDSNDDDVEHFS